MLTAIKTKAKRTLLIASLLINAGFFIEHGVGYAAVRGGMLQGRVVPPAVAFGGFDAKREQQTAMLADALPASSLAPPVDKMAPLPAHKPVHQ
jgi:hypothetical protein